MSKPLQRAQSQPPEPSEQNRDGRHVNRPRPHANGDGGMEALGILKRRLSDVVYRAMLTDQEQSSPAAA